MSTDPTYRQDLLLVVPAAGSRALGHVAAGSAIVATQKGDGLLCCYEGAIYHQPNNWDAILQAASHRLAADAPTVAKVLAPRSDAIVVGRVEYDQLVRRWVVSSIDDANALSSWRPQRDYVEGRTSEMVRAAAGLRYSQGLSHGAVGAYKAALGAGRSLDEACEALLQAK